MSRFLIVAGLLLFAGFLFGCGVANTFPATSVKVFVWAVETWDKMAARIRDRGL